jgi:hypothetical protein
VSKERTVSVNKAHVQLSLQQVQDLRRPGVGVGGDLPARGVLQVHVRQTLGPESKTWVVSKGYVG